MSLKSALGLHGVFWLYGSLGFVGFFAIYWTFSETEGRSLEDIEEFYKKGIRGKIPRKEISERVAKESSKKFSPSTDSITTEREDGVGISDVEVTNQLFTNAARKLKSSNEVNGELMAGVSTETVDTTFTVSTFDLQDPKSSTEDVNEKKDDVQQVADKSKEAKGQKSSEIQDSSEGTSDKQTSVEVKVETAEQNNDENSTQVNNEEHVEQRTKM